MKKANVALALAAGILGGMLSHFLTPATVRAETPTPAPSEVRARSFLLVNERGGVIGTFTADTSGRPVIRLLDVSGREIWSAEGPSLHGSPGR